MRFCHSFNIRSFGSNFSAGAYRWQHDHHWLFQYPLFRIELLCNERVARRERCDWCFNIRSFGSNFSAMSAFRRIWFLALFQYPLFRIELLCQAGVVPTSLTCSFQYPLFRIELLCIMTIVSKGSSTQVSISALSDRTSLRQASALGVRYCRSFNIRSFGSNFSANCAVIVIVASFGFNIRSFGSNFSALPT